MNFYTKSYIQMIFLISNININIIEKTEKKKYN